ncbi:MAG: nitrogen fixation NifU-like protein [Paraglaciecola sp.]|jgi:nitrogen fixation NifU-like protein
MSNTSIYKKVLMGHYQNPRHRGDLTDAQVVRRGSNPRCGDDIEVGGNFTNEIFEKVMFCGRGCSVCLACAFMVTETVSGKSKAEVHQLVEGMRTWFAAKSATSDDRPADHLQALEAVRSY